jgi:hypothetical protein
MTIVTSIFIMSMDAIDFDSDDDIMHKGSGGI